MSPGKYKAIIMDLDGTAMPFRKDAMPRPKVISAIKKIKKFVRVSISTSRPLFMARDIIKILGVNAPCSVNDSTKIYDPVKNKVLQTIYLDQKYAIVTKKVFEEKKIPFSINIGNREFKYHGGPLPKRICGMFATDITEQVADNLVDAITDRTPVAAQKFHTWTPGTYWMTVTNALATKLHSVLTIAELIGVKPKEIIGIGDGYNDFPLLEASGLKIAMGNAVPELKAIADFVAPSVDEDGVATVIEKFVL